MLSNGDINNIINDCKQGGYDIRVRDISYIILSNIYENDKIAYRCLYEDDVNFEEYKDSNKIKFLNDYIKENHLLSKKTKEEELTFQQNKKEIQNVIDRIEKGITEGTIDPDKGLKMIGDFRFKLTKELDVKEEAKDQFIVVEKKFNSICPYCHREISIPKQEEKNNI